MICPFPVIIAANDFYRGELLQLIQNKLAADILERQGVSFDVLLPLIDETAQKVHSMHPHDAQTGPAVRYDENVINAQLQLLADEPLKQQVNEIMSKSIHHD